YLHISSLPHKNSLERMRAVRSDGELELKQQLVRGRSFRVLCAAQLAANLAELARPVGQHQRLAGIMLAGGAGTLGPVKTRAGVPAACKLIVRREVVAEGALRLINLLPPAPDPFRAPDERVINRAAQRLPAHRGVKPGKLLDVTATKGSAEIQTRCSRKDAAAEKLIVHIIVAASVRAAELQIGGIIEVAVATQPNDAADVAAPRRLEQAPRIALIDLRC